MKATVSSDGTVRASLTVPNEEKSAGTVKITLVFPDTPALTTAQPDPVNGWTRRGREERGR